jgi:hypothetical protein
MTSLVAIYPLFVIAAAGLNSLAVKNVGVASQDDDIYYVTKMSDRFLSFLSKHEDAVAKFGAAEMDRLRSAIQSAPQSRDKALLEETARVNEENRLEAQNAFSRMRNFATTLKQAMGAVGSASRCEELTCGAHAYCAVDAALGAQCLCKEGYQGNGFICQTPMQFAIHSLIQFQPGQPHPKVADINVHTLRGDTIVAVYRDISNAHKGYALLGHATPENIRWHSPILFSNESRAFDPVIVQLQEESGHRGGIAIAYRDADRGGDGILVGGKISALTGEISVGTPKAFARHQAQAMAMLPLPDSRVAVIFAEHLLDDGPGQPRGGAMYGATLLAQVHTDGQAPQVINKERFAKGPVARLSVAALSPSLFAIAYRQGEIEPQAAQAEAACIAGQVRHNSIYFNSPAILLEPDQKNIWSRSLSRIGDNLLAYTYHSGNERVTKQAIISADAKTHHLKVVSGPEAVAHGFTPVVGSVALVPTIEDLAAQDTGPSPVSFTEQRRQQSVRLLTYAGHDGPKPAQARLCGISSSGIPSGCRDISWASHDLVSGSGTPLSDGRFLFLFTDARGNAFYQFVGLMDPLII